jgi:hypothetical protein
MSDTKKYIIRYNIGYGDMYEVVEVDNQDEADMYAYDAWKEEAECNADYGSEEYSEELAEDYGL